MTRLLLTLTLILPAGAQAREVGRNRSAAPARMHGPIQVLVGLNPYDFLGDNSRQTRRQVQSFMRREFPGYPAVPRSYRSAAYRWINAGLPRSSEGLLEKLSGHPATEDIEGRFKGGYGVWFKRRLTRGPIEKILEPYDGEIVVLWENSPNISLRVRVPGHKEKEAEIKFRSYQEIAYTKPEPTMVGK